LGEILSYATIMPLRILVFYGLVAALFANAFRNWFLSLCGLVALVGVIGNMPKTVTGRRNTSRV
jgi:hypothetical protein